jgi:H+-transporting ATPase
MDIEQEKGLTEEQIGGLHVQYGYNELPRQKENIILVYLKSFWGPLAWLMEVLIVISLFSHQVIEGLVVALLLVTNSIIAMYQRRSADAALTALTKKLSVFARVKRSGVWQNTETRELVPGDIVHVRTGNIVPADAVVISGNVSVDISSLTGESFPKEIATDETIFSGSIIQRGEAIARVTAIGAATAYGKTTQLLETSHPPTHMEKIIFTIIKYSFFVNLALVIAVVIFGVHVHAATDAILNFSIVLLLTSVPISFPTMFTVAQSYGALELSKDTNEGVLVRRLAAVQECAMVDVFCSDKTGTLTQNKLKVEKTLFYDSSSEHLLLGVADACCDKLTASGIDGAIMSYVAEKNIPVLEHAGFVPFDFTSKRTEADVVIDGTSVHALMGLPELLLTNNSSTEYDTAQADVIALSSEGLRVIAVVIESPYKKCLGLIALADPIKEDAPRIIQELKMLGVKTVMITGDGRVTAQAVARKLGLSETVVTAAELKQHPEKATESVVFAEAYPEDKLFIIRALQQSGSTVGMTGDGVNDAPALRQAEVGIAVFGATDVAKQSASFILTNDGLEGVVKAIQVSRQVYGRLRTWAMNKIIKSIEVSLFTTILFFVTHSYILSPLLAVLLVFANDFVTISIATDRTGPVARPARWNIGRFTIAALMVALVPLTLLLLVYKGAVTAGYSLTVIRTIIYLALIFFGKATLYGIRAWPHGWSIRPSTTLVVATVFSCLFALTLSIFGFLIAPVSIIVTLYVLLIAIVSFFGVDMLKSTGLVKKLFNA